MNIKIKFKNLLIISAFVLASTITVVSALDLSKFSTKDVNTGLKDALKQGANYAVSTLGQENGFFNNSKVHIPLPESLKKVEEATKLLGLSGEFSKLEKTLNTSAEMAVTTAKPILLDAINKITFEDAKKILAGGDDSVTQYFRGVTSAQLQQKFLPIVKNNTAKLNVAEQYNKIAGPAASFGLLDRDAANLDAYVTSKATDALFMMIAEKEKELRSNPAGAATSILQKLFSTGK